MLTLQNQRGISSTAQGPPKPASWSVPAYSTLAVPEQQISSATIRHTLIALWWSLHHPNAHHSVTDTGCTVVGRGLMTQQKQQVSTGTAEWQA